MNIIHGIVDKYTADSAEDTHQLAKQPCADSTMQKSATNAITGLQLTMKTCSGQDV